MGNNHTKFRFFLTDIGQAKIILGFLWMVAIQPNIDWKNGWIDYAHLPVVIKTPDAHQIPFINKKNAPIWPADNLELPEDVSPSNMPLFEEGDQLLIAQLTVETKDDPLDKIPLPYQQYAKVFSEEVSHEFPPSRDRKSVV